MPESNNVRSIRVKPKTIKRHYRKCDIVIRYQPSDQRWHWEVFFQPAVRKFTGDNASMAIAINKARAKVDYILDGE